MAREAFVVLLAGLCLLAPAAVSAQNVFDTVSSTTGLTLLTNAISLAGLQPQFSNSSLNITLFAPSDTAFGAALALLGLTQAQLVANAVKMSSIILYHAVQPAVLAENIPVGIASWPVAFNTANYSNITTENLVGSIEVQSLGSDANITTEDLSAGSSVVHIVDQVLLPFYPSIASAINRNPALNTLSTLATSFASSLLNKLSNVTVQYTMFAPTDSGFTSTSSAALSTLINSEAGVVRLLNYHIVPSPVIFATNVSTTPMVLTTLGGLKLAIVKQGSSIIVITPTGNATVTASYQTCFTANGTFLSVVHVINRVLVPVLASSTMEALAFRADVVNFAAAMAVDTTYSTGVLTSTTFRGTVLVPTDAAWSSMLATYSLTPAQLLANPVALKQLLNLHVIPNTVLTVSTLTNGLQLTTNSGPNTLTVNNDGSTIRISSSKNTATVIGLEYYVGDVSTVIVIDTVLIPGGWSGAASLALPSSLTMLVCSVFAVALLHVFGKQ